MSAANVWMPFAACDHGEVLQQHGRKPPSRLLVAHGERNLGFVRRDPVVARDRDELVAAFCDEDDVIVLVRFRDVLELRGSRSRHR